MNSVIRLLWIGAGLCLLAPQAVRAEAGASITIGQAGLSGRWADPATPGQQLALQVLPDAATGQTLIAGAWFTFTDIVVTDARSQRWYTLQGSAQSSAGGGELTLFESTQGQFAQAGVVTRPVGKATLSFSDCMHGTLTYAFDGEGQPHGLMPLQRQGSNVSCSTDGSASLPAGIGGLSGAWFDPAILGQGVFFDLDPALGSLSAAWSTYLPAGSPQVEGAWRQRWFTLRAQISDIADLRDVPIYSWVGGTFATNNPPPTASVVGSASVAFEDCDHATLTYHFTGGDLAGHDGATSLRHLHNAQTCDASARNIQGHVVVPAGVSTTDLTVLGTFSETGVDSRGNFSLPRTGAAPSITGVVHAMGGTLYFGVLDTALAANVDFDAHSSAVALLFQAIGGAVLTGEQRRHVIALIGSDPGTKALADVIAAEQGRDPFVLEHVSQPILDSINAVVRGWTPTATVQALRSASRFVHAALRPLLVRAATSAASADDTSPQQLLIVGDTELSGFTLNLGDGNNNVIVQNSKRRPGLVHVFTTGFTDADGVHTDLPLVEEQGDAISVPATRRLSTWSSFTSIGSLLSSVLSGKDLPTGTIPWSPIDSPPITISGRDGAVTTDVDVLVLTGVWNGHDRAFEDNYGAQNVALKNDLLLLRAKQLLDATVVALLENLGIGGAVIADVPLATVREIAAVTFSAPSFSEIYAGLAEGSDLAGTIAKILRFLPMNAAEAAGANAAVAQLRQQVFDEAMAQYTAANSEILGRLSEQGIALNTAKLEAAATNARVQLANATKRVLLAVSAILAGVDTIAQGVDQLNGDDSANFFHVKVIRPTVRLEPRQSEIGIGDTLKFKATVRGFEDDPSLSFGWTLDSADQSVLDDLHGNHVAGSGSFDSALPEVSFITGDLITRADVAHRVTVQVFYKNKSGVYELFGEATATVTIGGYQVGLSPDEVTMRHDQQRTFNIDIAPFPDAGTLAALQFEWSAETNGRCGTLTSAGASNSASQPVVTTTSAHATYVGDPSNPANCFADIVHVNLFTSIGGVRKDLGKAEATIVFTDFDIVFPAVAPVAIGSTTPIAVTLSPPAPLDATVVWTWAVSGDASKQSQTDGGGTGSQIALHAGASAGTATVTVRADVTLSNGLVERLGARTRQIEVSANLPTALTAGPVQYYTTDRCTVAYVTLPRIAGASQYRITQVSGVSVPVDGPSNTTGGFTVMETPRVSVGLIYDVLDTPVPIACTLTPLSLSLTGDATSLRLPLGRALNVDGATTPSWTAAWEASFHQAFDSASIHAEAAP